MRTLSRTEFQYWARRALAWAPVWLLALAVHVWALWIIMTVEPTMAGRLSSTHDPVLFIAALCLSPAVLVLILGGVGAIGLSLRWLWRWCQRMDGRAQRESLLKSYRGEG